jgi:hypothetical protein
MVQVTETCSPNVVHIILRGKLSGEDFKRLHSIVDAAESYGAAIQLVVQLQGIKACPLRAIYHYLSFHVKNHSRLRAIAIVGGGKWAIWAVIFCMLFTKAELNCFGAREIESALSWLQMAGHVPLTNPRMKDGEQAETWSSWPWFGV